MFISKENKEGGLDEGLTYNSEVLGDLVSKDTDLDGIADWEEFLWGTDPKKKDTDDDGIPDNIEIEELKKQQRQEGSLPILDNENLTETDKFSREFFSTVAALNQNGSIDQETVDKLSTSLAERIQNSTQRKVYETSDIKIIKDDNLQAIKIYNNELGVIFEEYKGNEAIIDVLKRFVVDEDSVDIAVLLELNPIIEEMGKITDGMTKINVPQSFSFLHINLLNGLQRVSENLSDIKLYENDVIVSLGAMSKYEENTATLESATYELKNAIWQKVKI